VNRVLSFAAASAVVIGVTWGVGVLLFQDADVQRALGISAALAFGIQMVAFLIARRFAQRKNVIAGWGIGVALRFGALLIFGLIGVPRLDVPLSAALLGLAIFLFVSTLIEPLFLRT
jgi:hypothetical protein